MKKTFEVGRRYGFLDVNLDEKEYRPGNITERKTDFVCFSQRKKKLRTNRKM